MCLCMCMCMWQSLLMSEWDDQNQPFGCQRLCSHLYLLSFYTEICLSQLQVYFQTKLPVQPGHTDLILVSQGGNVRWINILLLIKAMMTNITSTHTQEMPYLDINFTYESQIEYSMFSLGKHRSNFFSADTELRLSANSKCRYQCWLNATDSRNTAFL